MDIYEPPKSEAPRNREERMAVFTTGFVVVMFILSNMTGALRSVQVMNTYGYGWNTGFGVMVMMEIATYVVRCSIAALFFLKVRWFYWILVASMLGVYLVPVRMYPDGIVNAPIPVALVILMAIPLALGLRRYVLPWRYGDKRDGGD
jgi:hypothetical protein